MTQIGQIVGTHGVKGGLKIRLMTDFPSRFQVGESVVFGGKEHKILRSSFHKDQVRIQIDAIKSMTEAELLKWMPVFAPEGSRPKMEHDEFLDSDLLGMTLVDLDDVAIGCIEEVIHVPGQSIFRSGEMMIPAVKEFIVKIDIQNSKVVVDLPEGYLEGDDVEPVH